MKSSSFFLVVFSLLCAVSCRSDIHQGVTGGYFIDGQRGDDKNNGDSGHPVRTLARLNELLSVELKNVHLTGGQVYEGTLTIKDKEAVPGNPVSISSAGRGRAVINGGNGEAVRIENCRNIRVKNIDIRGNGRKTGNTTNGFALVRSSDCSIEYLKTEGFQKSGVDLYDCRNCEVKNVLAADNGFCGINIMGSSYETSGKILVQDCMAENNSGDPTILDNHSGNGILVGVSDSVIIDRCRANNNGWDMPRLGNGPVGIWAWQSDHVIIQYCISYRNKTSPGAKDGGGFDLDGGVTNSIIRFCISYGNEGAGYGLFQYPGASGWSDNIIKYCISCDDANTTEGAGSIFLWNGSNEKGQLKNCRINHNIIFSTKAPAISFENASLHENLVFKRNIFIYAGSRLSGENSGSSFSGNLWLNADWKNKTGRDPHH